MRRPRLGIGAELVPLVLILGGLAGSLGLIVEAYRRVNFARAAPTKSLAVAVAPVHIPDPLPKPSPATLPPTKVVEPPKPTPVVVEPPPPEDPTPKALAELASAEVEQVLEASKANRKAQALEEARQAAIVESERWRRRQSLIHSQINTLESKVRKVETDLDAMALERDALEKELDARKAAAARAKSRPGQAILPHKGPNGTWRRPIVIECRNGGAVIQPQGIEFSLFELENGFGTMSNPFVGAVAREAIRIQRKASPDGAPVVPYIFFLVRPDGIRPYYEARGRLEPLGITFGYELADQDWQVELPNLDDTATWDGSEPIGGSGPASTLAGSPPGAGTGASAEDSDLPHWPTPRQTGNGPGSEAGGPFAFGGGSSGVGRNSPWTLAGSRLARMSAGSGGGSARGGPGSNPNLRAANGPADPSVPDAPPEGFPAEFEPRGGGPTRLAASGGDRPSGPAGPRVDASGRVVPGTPRQPAGLPGARTPRTGPAGHSDQPGGSSDPGQNLGGKSDLLKPSTGEKPPSTLELGLEGPTADEVADSPPPLGAKPDESDPALTFVWPATRDRDRQGKKPSEATGTDSYVSLPTTNPDREAGSTPGIDETIPPGVGGSASRSGQPASGGGGQAAKRTLGPASRSGQPSANPANSSPPPGAAGLGLNAPAMPSPSSPSPAIPPQISPMDLPIPTHLPTPTETAATVRRQARPSVPDWSPSGSIVDKTFEIVVVCEPRGVIVQPGNYRVTADALKDREGLFKKQVVALVKNRRLVDPKIQVEPRIRFLVQPRGFDTYRMARSQFFVSGLNWPTTTQVADPDPLAISPGGVW